MFSTSRVTSLAVLATAILGTGTVASQWPTDPATNLAVAVDPYASESPKATSDDQGGMIVAWVFSGPSDTRNIYLQRVNSFGAQSGNATAVSKLVIAR